MKMENLRKNRQYDLIEHTADIGVRVRGRDLEELFVNAALAMVDIMVSAETVNEERTVEIKLEAANVEELLRSWLSEVHYYFVAKKIIPAKFTFNVLDEHRVDADLLGQVMNLKRHIPGTEIKAVTYHELRVTSKDGGWEAQVIFDI
jgi:SHS2 domain-containing protein